MPSPMQVVGLMSGTSLDGIDCALVQIAGRPPTLSVRLEAFATYPYDEDQRCRLARLCAADTGRVPDVNALNFALATWCAEATLATLETARMPVSDLDLIASHGQTIHHAVGPAVTWPATLQIGDPSVLAQCTGVTTIGNFRTADVAAGGQGAPLVSYVDWLLWRDARETRVIVNIGGIANLTYLPAGAQSTDVLAYDTGPGNLLIDDCVRRVTAGTQCYDPEGRLARQGQVDEAWLNTLLTDPFFAAPPPKTTGRERYGPAWSARLWQEASRRRLEPLDVLATVTALTAVSITQSIRNQLPRCPDRVWVGGGGRHNQTLMNRLQVELADIPVLPVIPAMGGSDAKEALAFAVLGYETIHGRPGNLPSCTGAAHRVVLGQIAPGSNWSTLMHRVQDV